MRIIAFIQDTHTISDIIKAAGPQTSEHRQLSQSLSIPLRLSMSFHFVLFWWVENGNLGDDKQHLYNFWSPEGLCYNVATADQLLAESELIFLSLNRA